MILMMMSSYWKTPYDQAEEFNSLVRNCFRSFSSRIITTKNPQTVFIYEHTGSSGEHNHDYELEGRLRTNERDQFRVTVLPSSKIDTLQN